VPILTPTMDPAAAFRRRLETSRGVDGGYPPFFGGASEPEPTALASLALDDQRARAWLSGNQRRDGSFGISLGGVNNDSATALAALALGHCSGAERALDHVVRSTALVTPPEAAIPYNPDYPGWGWTTDAFGWTEPTARALLALRIMRPAASASIFDALGMLADRECVGGGWNYGNRTVFDVELPPYAQTTAIALIGLQAHPTDVVARGLARLKELWRAERDGTLSVATAATALLVQGDRDADAALHELASHDATATGDVVALAWATIALGDGVQSLKVA
jgi:hypothetical protein